MSTETQSGGDEQREIPEHVLNELREAGASNLFLNVIQTTAKEAGVERNSSRQEILKYIRWSKDSENDVADYLSYGGGFFQSLLNGNTGGADHNNQRILRYVRTEQGAGASTGVQSL